MQIRRHRTRPIPHSFRSLPAFSSAEDLTPGATIDHVNMTDTGIRRLLETSGQFSLSGHTQDQKLPVALRSVKPNQWPAFTQEFPSLRMSSLVQQRLSLQVGSLFELGYNILGELLGHTQDLSGVRDYSLAPWGYRFFFLLRCLRQQGLHMTGSPDNARAS